MKRQHHAVISIALASSIALAACTSAGSDAASSPATEVAPATTSATTPTTTTATGTAPPGATEDSQAIADQFDLDRVVSLIADSYASTAGKWSGFDMKNEPVVLGLSDPSGQLVGALTFNHPAVDELGDAVRHGETSDDVGDVFVITNLTSETADRLAAVRTFDFHAQLGGVDSFAMIAGGDDSFFDPSTLDYASTLVHEAFHRWQDRGFDGDIGDQDVDGYAYTPENLALAALEERVLIAALDADSDDDRQALARQLAAIRLTRRAADPRVRLDDNQERYEGTARWLEHVIAGSNDGFAYHDANHGGELVSDPTEALGIKEHYGFGRFYASGAALIEVADRLGVQDPTGQINRGSSPIDLLIDATGVTEADAAALTAEAREQHDPDGELPDLAAEAATQAEGEPGVFDDIEGGVVGGGSEDGSFDDAIEVTDAQLMCLTDLGLDLDDPSSELTGSMIEQCL